jgi:ABC-type lipoprotein export system ATPase subunit
MGASGGGKTTLIDILAGRKNVGTVEGKILINGEKRKSSFKRITGYVLQDDVMMGTLTVREQITYSAMLRLPSIMPHEEKLRKVDLVMEELGITHIANSVIGTDMTRGISGGERKRVSIATELVTEPSILFLDEPTSGLDAYNASALMVNLKKLALEHNTTVVMSIHLVRTSSTSLIPSCCCLTARPSSPEHLKTLFLTLPSWVTSAHRTTTPPTLSSTRSPFTPISSRMTTSSPLARRARRGSTAGERRVRSREEATTGTSRRKSTRDTQRTRGPRST